MGFFESLIGGFHDVASWLNDNSGTIGTIVNTITKVAGGILLGSEHDGETTDQSPMQMPEFVNLIGQASSVLEQASEKQTWTLKSAEPTPGLDPSNSSTINTIRTFSGLWTQPASFNKEGHPPQFMTQDVSQMLTMCGFPQVIMYGPETDSRPLNVAETIAEQIFANIPVNPLSVAEGEDPFTTLTFNYTSTKGDMSIKGAHSYYQIPMGTSASNNVWHGVVHMNATMDRKASDAYRAQALATSKVTPRAITTGVPAKTSVGDVSYNVWAVTLKITWPDGVIAQRLGPTVAHNISISPAVVLLESNDVTGAIQRLKVWGQVDMVPAGIRATVTGIVASVLAGAAVGGLANVTVVGSCIVPLQHP